jgi:hypothetical protein
MAIIPIHGINHTLKFIILIFVFNDEYDVPKDWEERAVFWKIQLLHIVLEECLNIYHAKALVHPEYHEANNVYLKLKKHALELTMEKLSHDILIQYMKTIHHPGHWHGTLFPVVLYWYDQIKPYMWLKLIGLLPTQTCCLLQKAVEDVMAIEYVKKC